jgi:glycosyltransferase involved in cell wall biosynthesis
MSFAAAPTFGAKPKLLIVGPLPKHIGGVEIFTELLLNSTAFEGFRVQHFDITKNRPKQTQGQFDLANFLWAARFFFGMCRKMWSFSPQVVYMPVGGTWSGFSRDAVLAFIAKLFGARVVGHVHGSRIDRVLRDRPRRWWVTWALRQWDMLLPLGEGIGDLFRRRGFGGRLVVVPSTVRKELLEAGSKFGRRVRTEGTVQGLFVGQLGQRKGVYDLLHAVRRVKDAGLPFRLQFVGPGEFEGEWENLLELRTQLGVEDTTEFVGPQVGAELMESFKQADFLIMPSYKEGMPAVFHEAGAFSLPVVATPVGAITDLIHHGSNGLVVEPGNIEQISAAIETMVTDPESRGAMGRQLRLDVSDFDPDKVCSRVADVVRVAASETARAASSGAVKVAPWLGLLILAEVLAMIGLR